MEKLNMRLFLVAFVLILQSIVLAAEPPFGFLMGHWKGESNKVGVIRSSEECNYQTFNGNIAVIQARYLVKETGQVLEELAVMSPTPTDRVFDFTMWKENGSKMNAIATIDPAAKTGLLEIEIPASSASPAMKARYNIKVDGTDWLEVGAISTDQGKTWKSVYENRMQKIADICAQMPAE